MRPRTSPGGKPTAQGPAVFDRVLVGIDSTEESLVAVAQAGVLKGPNGRLVLVAAVERHKAAQAGFLAALAQDGLAAETSIELERARELVDTEEVVLAAGDLVRLLGSECERRRGTLIAVGVRSHRRLGTLTFGGHDLEALHDVSCSLLIARPGWGPASPERIVVGVDGSPEARGAEAVARSLAGRLGCEVVPVVALGEEVDLGLLRAERDDALLQPGPLLDAVVGASTPRSLIVVGRARQPGRRWRGNLTGRLVTAAACSVLVVDHDSGAATLPSSPQPPDV
jgi:nucleotide-binding universal stress UspA family protein